MSLQCVCVCVWIGPSHYMPHLIQALHIWVVCCEMVFSYRYCMFWHFCFFWIKYIKIDIRIHICMHAYMIAWLHGCMHACNHTCITIHPERKLCAFLGMWHNSFRIMIHTHCIALHHRWCKIKQTSACSSVVFVGGVIFRCIHIRIYINWCSCTIGIFTFCICMVGCSYIGKLHSSTSCNCSRLLDANDTYTVSDILSLHIACCHTNDAKIHDFPIVSMFSI